MVDVKECTYEEALLRQLHIILEIWGPLKVFTNLYCKFIIIVNLNLYLYCLF